MRTKKTIAILGLTEEAENPFLSKLAQHYRLLIISDHAKNYTELSDYVHRNTDEAVVELIDCAKDGCWEADIILLWDGFRQEAKELQRLQAVATQKIVLILTEQEKSTSNSSLFPHAKVITLFQNPITKEAQITGENSEAVQTITALIGKSNYYKLTEKTK